MASSDLQPQPLPHRPIANTELGCYLPLAERDPPPNFGGVGAKPVITEFVGSITEFVTCAEDAVEKGGQARAVGPPHSSRSDLAK